MSEHYIYGIHAVTALLNNPSRPTKKLLLCEGKDNQRYQSLLELAMKQQIAIEWYSMQKMKQRFPDCAHQGVVAVTVKMPVYQESDIPRLLAWSEKPWSILILDGVTDPHNLGACLRSADAAGINFVMIPKDKNADLTPTVSKVASGAAESVPLVRVTNLARSMELLKQEGVWIYGAAGEAKDSLYDLDCMTSIAFVMGAEDKGIRHLTRSLCDGVFSLPMLGTVSSLNVSVATGVCLYEMVRQRNV